MLFLKRNRCLIPAFVMMLALSGCGIEKENTTVPKAQPMDAVEDFFEVTTEDLRTEMEGEVRVELTEPDEDLNITKGGDYLLSGEFRGTVYIDTHEHPVHLFLYNATIESPSDNAVYVRSASKVVITALPGTDNSISDSPEYSASDETACIFSESDLTINGEGTLSITGLCDDAIHSKDVVKILAGDLHIQAKGNAVKGNDGILVRDGKVLLEAEKSGLVTSRKGTGGKGSILMENTDLSVIAGEYGIISFGDLWIRSGNYYIKGIMDAMKVSGNTVIEPGAVINE